MIGWGRRVLLRHYLDEGLAVTEISRELGISRQTIYRWINEGELDRDLEEVRYGPRPPVPTKLDPYRAIVRERLEEYPELTAVRLLAEIRAAGYPGGYTQLREYVRKVRPRPPADPLVRFETDPGVQGQVDFAHFRFPWGRRYALLVVLGYSRPTGRRSRPWPRAPSCARPTTCSPWARPASARATSPWRSA